MNEGDGKRERKSVRSDIEEDTAIPVNETENTGHVRPKRNERKQQLPRSPPLFFR